MERMAILEERQKTHGSFSDNARISQGIKNLVGVRRHERPDVFNESMDMIALKLSRIASGRHNEPDHWQDIIGYAGLALEEIKRLENPAPYKPMSM